MRPRGWHPRRHRPVPADVLTAGPGPVEEARGDGQLGGLTAWCRHVPHGREGRVGVGAGRRGWVSAGPPGAGEALAPVTVAGDEATELLENHRRAPSSSTVAMRRIGPSGPVW